VEENIFLFVSVKKNVVKNTIIKNKLLKIRKQRKKMKLKRKKLNYKTKTDNVELVTELPNNGTWLPISVAAQTTGYSAQMIRHLYKNKIIKAIKFKNGPILVNQQDILNNWLRS
jgi:regulator of PEP synthase PpsR (kinase-PPPase family)